MGRAFLPETAVAEKAHTSPEAGAERRRFDRSASTLEDGYTAAHALTLLNNLGATSVENYINTQ